MNKTLKIEREFTKAIKLYPNSAELYNDYAMFLYRYKNDYNEATNLLKKAIRLAPENKIYKFNYNKIIRQTEVKIGSYYNLLILAIVAIMVWLSTNGYNNFLNMFSLFAIAQIIINYKKNTINSVLSDILIIYPPKFR